MIGAALQKPTAILALSAHWAAAVPTISLSPRPETIHDFAGFAPELYSLSYPAPGAPELARRVIERFAETGTALHTNATRGLDHGAWVPLLAMFPQADIPVAQLALPDSGGAAELLALGTLLRPLRDQGVLILASGAITHNFGWLRWNEAESAAPLPRARAFADWVGERIAGHDNQALADYRNAPWGSEAHPSAEHLMPLFAALGAADGDPPTRHQPPFTYGGLAMDCYVWGAA
jgi:4,5-DOPA dioxygenase extradiol